MLYVHSSRNFADGILKLQFTFTLHAKKQIYAISHFYLKHTYLLRDRYRH